MTRPALPCAAWRLSSLALALLAGGCAMHPTAPPPQPAPVFSATPKTPSAPAASAGIEARKPAAPVVATGPTGLRASFGRARPPRDVRRIADWTMDSADHRDMPFAVLDKVHARVWLFDAGGRLQGQSPVLLGEAKGDDTAPGIGEKPLKDVKPWEKTTPAGRFEIELGDNARGEDVIWIDYDAAVSMHRVLTTNPAEHRLQRLATPTPNDNRISYGCVNVPKRFFEQTLAPAFRSGRGVVYVLPETRPVLEAFNAYEVSAKPVATRTKAGGAARAAARTAGSSANASSAARER